ncbi:MAG: replication-associated recombination protein A [Candidatus Omnitrophica bacterium]|nr:replication-associated recombination protein A [Candidatus Omnitrophota bacterium]
METLFELEKEESKKEVPLAMRMRPRNLQEFVGQKHILQEGSLLQRAILSDRISSLIFFGPSGTGKTALAYIIANSTKGSFKSLNAVTSFLADVRNIIAEARERRRINKKRTILFIDELHHFNKSQQDAFMADVEDGTIILIGATVHNPYFAINSPLLSRSLVFEFKPLEEKDLLVIMKRALLDKEGGLGNFRVRMEEEALHHLAKQSEGDARRALNALEIGVLTTRPDKQGMIQFTLAVAEESIQRKVVLYDKDEDEHYNTISAFIKSMRGSDPDATLYWLAKMIVAGEDPRFIARRIVICAAEDVGNADPQALVLANSALQVSEFVGMPEAKIPLAQAAVYVATCPKSNSSYLGIEKAIADVEKGKTLEVPKHLQVGSYKGAEKLGRGQNYLYPHNYKDHLIKQEYIPERKKYYQPSGMGYEKVIRERMEKLEKLIKSGRKGKDSQKSSETAQ